MLVLSLIFAGIMTVLVFWLIRKALADQRRVLEIWREVALWMGAEIPQTSPGRWSVGQFCFTGRVAGVPLTLDTFVVPAGKSYTTYTRAKTPVDASGVTFQIYREGSLSKLGKVLGAQDVQCGDAEYDQRR